MGHTPDDDALPDDPRPKFGNWYDFFLAIDMFGVTPQLEIKGKRKFKSCFGACWSFLAIIIILAYWFLKTIYVLQEAEIAIGGTLVDIVEEIIGLSQDTTDDLELEFSDVQDGDATSKIANWYLVQKSGDGLDEIKTVLYLNAAKKKPTSIIYRGVDTVAQAGGFLFFIWFFFSFIVEGINIKLYNRQILQDTYLAKKTTELIDIIAVKTSKKKGFAKIQKQKINKEENDLDDEEMDKSGYDSMQEEGGETSRHLTPCHKDDMQSIYAYADSIQQEQNLNSAKYLNSQKSFGEVEMQQIDEEENNASDSSDTYKEGGSSKGPRSDISGRSRGGASAMSKKSRADSYAPSQAAESNASQLIKGGGRGGTRRKATDYMKVNISTARIICLGCTPRCCRTKGQSALARLLQKGYNKLQRELDVGAFLKRSRDSQNLVLSYMQARCFNPQTLYSDYQQHYSNVIDVEINTERSIEEEFAQPIGVDYMDPQPVCVCPDLGEENLVKIAETAYGILKCETELNQKIGDSVKNKRKSTKGFGGGSRGGRSEKGNNPTTLEGGAYDSYNKMDISVKHQNLVSPQQQKERDSSRPSIMYPKSQDGSQKGIKQLDFVNFDEAVQKRLSTESQKQSDSSKRDSYDQKSERKSNIYSERKSYKDSQPLDNMSGFTSQSPVSRKSRSPTSRKSSRKSVDHRDIQLKAVPQVYKEKKDQSNEEDLSIIAENTKETNSLATPINTVPPTPPSHKSKKRDGHSISSKRVVDDDAVSSKSRKSSRSKSTQKKVSKDTREDERSRGKSASKSKDKSRSEAKKAPSTTPGLSSRSKLKLEVVPESEMDGMSEKTHKSSRSRKPSRSKDQERQKSSSKRK